MHNPTASSRSDPLLGGLTPAQFLAQYWQKRPLLVRQAVPGFRGLATRATLTQLAAREDVESRLFQRRGARWQVQGGPLPRALFARLPARQWTLLVQGLNLHLPAADALLRRFSFVPYARLDDLMVSYAVDGGGVGPHFDAYDVFLLQGEGRRRWRISRQKDRSLDTRAPHRLLANFRPQQEWVLEPGDMLYLPPQCAHDGVALGTCTTYSIGFRTPSAQEFGTAFLDHLRDKLCLAGMYADPDLRVQAHPAAISPAMVGKAEAMLRAIRFNREDVKQFLGIYLSEPKQQIVFSRPQRPMGPAAFRAALDARGARLARSTIMLFDEARIYINGEAVRMTPGLRSALRALRALADHRVMLPHTRLSAPLQALLHGWYCDGWLLLGAIDG